MAHPLETNKTRFAYQSLFSTDEDGYPVMSPLVKATFALGKTGGLTIPDEQDDVSLTGEVRGDPDTGSYIYEPETAFIKLATDVVLIGHARATTGAVSQLDCGLRVGPLKKVVRVIGNRSWVKHQGAMAVTAAKNFEHIPLIYENAFGGREAPDPDTATRMQEMRNPVGTGFATQPLAEGKKLRLPNLEDPQDLLQRYGQTPAPAGFGFVSPNWQSRAHFCGTYDAAWLAERSPLLPKDFDRRFFNAASPGLIASGYLTGNEPVTIVNASPVARLDFSLPGMPAPQCDVHLHGGAVHNVATNLDTIIINTDAMKVNLLWRGLLRLRRGPHDVQSVTVDCAHPAARRHVEAR